MSETWIQISTCSFTGYKNFWRIFKLFFVELLEIGTLKLETVLKYGLSDFVFSVYYKHTVYFRRSDVESICLPTQDTDL